MALLKKKSKKKNRIKGKDKDVTLDIGSSFDVADAKEEDFELDLDAASFVGRCGQAGNRQRGG